MGHSAGLDSAIMAVYIIIYIVAMIGNTLLLAVILRFRQLRQSFTNRIILNMSISDVIFTFTILPFDYYRYTEKAWVFKEFACKLALYTKIMSLYVSAWSMAVIALDRYQSILHPTSRRFATLISPYWIMSGIWAFSLIASYPFYQLQALVPSSWSNETMVCGLSVSINLGDSKSYPNTFWFLFSYVFPLGITAVCYFKIGYFLHKRPIVGIIKSCTPGDAKCERELRIQKSKRKTVKILAAITLAFAICQLPTELYFFISEIDPKFWTEKLLPITSLGLIANWLTLEYVINNPLICFLFNDDYKKALRSMIPAWMVPWRYFVIVRRADFAAHGENSQGMVNFSGVTPEPTSSTGVAPTQDKMPISDDEL